MFSALQVTSVAGFPTTCVNAHFCKCQILNKIPFNLKKSLRLLEVGLDLCEKELMQIIRDGNAFAE